MNRGPGARDLPLARTDIVANWSPLRALLAEIETSLTVSWGELDSLVGGLPKSAYVHSAFWKGDRSGWPGFTTTSVKVGGSVTFIRRGARPQAAHGVTPGRAARSAGTAPDLILVGCVKQKLGVGARGRELYTSPLFRKERAYAEESGTTWFILSAEHGLVDPDAVLQPYDLRLSTTSGAYREAWGARVLGQLREAAGSIKGKTIELHAGSAYTDAIRDRLKHEGATVVEPLAGLPLGARLAWYARAAEQAFMGTNPPPAASDEDITQLIARLAEAERAITRISFSGLGETACGLRVSTAGGSMVPVPLT
jgi:hypothetical protein